MEKTIMYYSAYCLIFAILLLSFSSAYGDDLKIGYYNDKCPGAEETIRKTVTDAVSGNNIGLCAGVLRLHFHDCFVRGCDGSVLLDKDAFSNPPEKSADNNLSLRGFEVIDAAKKAVEANCNVSCADVLAFAARDCVKILGGDQQLLADFHYDVFAGRLDGKVSIAQEAIDNLPGANFNVAQLQSNFAKKGLSLEDVVVLSGAHSVGVSHCSSFKGRFNPIIETEINKAYAESLKQQCSTNGNVDDSVTVPQDYVTPNKLDVQYYINQNNNTVLFFSDWVLRTNSDAQNSINTFANDPLNIFWLPKFKDAMQRMGKIIELSADQGEIRKVCSAVNT